MREAAIGYVHGGNVRAEFLASMLALSRKTDGVTAGEFIAIQSGPNISEARNFVAEEFLGSRLDWLLMVDTDMVFVPDALDRLVAAADPALRPVMGALCYSQDAGTGAPQPMMYQQVTDGSGQHGFIRYRHGPDEAGQPVSVSATTTAFLLVHRTALERVLARSQTPAAPWFMETPSGSALIGEDMTFCLRCADVGIPVHVHTGVEVGHVKSVILGNVS